MARKAIPAEALIDLRRRLGTFPSRSPERRRILQETAALYGVSEPTLYRLLRQRSHLHVVGRSDRGVPRLLPPAELERYLELIAAVKLRTANRKGRHLSTGEAIRLLEDYGLETPEGVVRAPKGVPKPPRSTPISNTGGWIGGPCGESRRPCGFKPSTATNCGSLI